MSEHRQLTAVDKLIKKEVTAAARNQCTHQMPIADVPHSPVFKPFDPIPLPLDDAVPDKVKIMHDHVTGQKEGAFSFNNLLNPIATN